MEASEAQPQVLAAAGSSLWSFSSPASAVNITIERAGSAASTLKQPHHFAPPDVITGMPQHANNLTVTVNFHQRGRGTPQEQTLKHAPRCWGQAWTESGTMPRGPRFAFSLKLPWKTPSPNIFGMHSRQQALLHTLAGKPVAEDRPIIRSFGP
jgi:hypothetical protein